MEMPKKIDKDKLLKFLAALGFEDALSAIVNVEFSVDCVWITFKCHDDIGNPITDGDEDVTALVSIPYNQNHRFPHGNK